MYNSRRMLGVSIAAALAAPALAQAVASPTFIEIDSVSRGLDADCYRPVRANDFSGRHWNGDCLSNAPSKARAKAKRAKQARKTHRKK